jgi:hypothetical protein
MNTPTKPDLYNECVAAGLQLDHHRSDLYILDTKKAREIVKRCALVRTSTFVSQVDGKLWIDVPFAYLPFWEKKA